MPFFEILIKNEPHRYKAHSLFIELTMLQKMVDWEFLFCRRKIQTRQAK